MKHRYMNDDDGDPANPAQVLASRLRLLLDAKALMLGHEPTSAEVIAAVTCWGVPLSRSRWDYMVNGRRYVDDPALREALAAYFSVDAHYLDPSYDGPLPEGLEAQLDLVRAMRAAKVKSFAMRVLGDVSPDTMRAITRHLDRDIERGPEKSDDDG